MKNIKNLLNHIYSTNFFIPISILLLMTIGAFLRIQQLNTDFWYDEAFTGIVVRSDWQEMFRLIELDKVHPPTFYILIKTWSLFFGTNEVGLRSFLLVLGVLLIPITYKAAKQISKGNKDSKIFGITAAALITFSPFFTVYSTEARSYMFLAIIGVLSLTVYFKILSLGLLTKLNINSESFKYWLLFLFLIAIIVGTHYLSIIIVTGYIVAIGLKILEEKDYMSKKTFWSKFWIFSILGIFSLVTVVYVSGLYTTIHGMNTHWIEETDLATLLRSTASFLFGVGKQIPGISPYSEFEIPIKTMSITFIIIIASVVALTKLWIENSLNHNKTELTKLYTLTALTFTPLFAFMMTSTIGMNTLVERYAIIPGAYLLIWLSYVWYKTLGKKVIILLIIYILSLTLLIPFPPITHYSELKEQISSSIIEFQNQESQNIENIIIYDPTDFILMKYYLPEINNFKVILPKQGNYNSWALISREEELVSYENCKTTCLYVINNTWINDELLKDNRLKILSKNETFTVFKLEK